MWAEAAILGSGVGVGNCFLLFLFLDFTLIRRGVEGPTIMLSPAWVSDIII